MTEPVSRRQAQQQDGGDDPVTDEEAVAALRNGTVRIGCVRGMAIEDVPPSALIAIVRTALELDRRPPEERPAALPRSLPPEPWDGQQSRPRPECSMTEPVATPRPDKQRRAAELGPADDR